MSRKSMKANQSTAETIIKARALERAGLDGQAVAACRTFLDTHPRDAGLRFQCADIAQRCGRDSDAIQWLQQAIQIDATQADYPLLLGRIYRRRQRLDEAISSFQRVLKIDPTQIAVHLELGLTHLMVGDDAQAKQHLLKATQANLSQAVALYWLGRVYLKQGDADKAVGCIKRAVTIDPTFSDARFQLGLMHLQRGELGPSRSCFYQVISQQPQSWRAWVNLCTVLLDMDEFDEAEEAGRRAVALNPDSHEAWHNLGNVHLATDDNHAAIRCFTQSTALTAKCDATHVGMGIAHQRMDDTENAIDCFKTALSINPKSATAISNLVNIYMLEGDWDNTSRYATILDEHTQDALKCGRVPEESPFLHLSRCDIPELNLAVARAWSRDIGRRMSWATRDRRFTHSNKRRQTIRIGYLSNNFSDHPTAHITRKLYQSHDRHRFEVFCFSYGSPDNSRYGHAIRDGCDHFIDIRNQTPAAAAKIINGRGIDILVDLVGFMRGNRMAIAALRPAPVQIRWLGMAGTTGAEFFDYLIADQTVIPKNQARFYSENLVYLPHCYQINDDTPYVDKYVPRKSDVGLPDDAFVFCCFNTGYKIDASIFASWMNILRRLPDSVLWLMAHSAKQSARLMNRTTELGIDAQRLIFAKKIPKPTHLARIALADVALDTLVVNGAASTSDALWAGVPVLTIQGNHFASRMSSSILKAAGLQEMITTSLEAYENRALQLAQDKAALARLRTRLQQTVGGSHLFNTRGFVAHLETAYEKIWHNHCQGKRPRMVDVRCPRALDPEP